MSSSSSDTIRIIDFGNALKLHTAEERYSKYGTPEYVAPEIVNQTPVSTATDIWYATCLEADPAAYWKQHIFLPVCGNCSALFQAGGSHHLPLVCFQPIKT